MCTYLCFSDSLAHSSYSLDHSRGSRRVIPWEEQGWGRWSIPHGVAWEMTCSAELGIKHRCLHSWISASFATSVHTWEHYSLMWLAVKIIHWFAGRHSSNASVWWVWNLTHLKDFFLVFPYSSLPAPRLPDSVFYFQFTTSNIYWKQLRYLLWMNNSGDWEQPLKCFLSYSFNGQYFWLCWLKKDIVCLIKFCEGNAKYFPSYIPSKKTPTNWSGLSWINS